MGTATSCTLYYDLYHARALTRPQVLDHRIASHGDTPPDILVVGLGETVPLHGEENASESDYKE